jgi:hypothetical protein
MSDVLRGVQNQISSLGGSELDAVQNMPMLQDMWDKLQDLRKEMNEAKKKASEEAAKPYLEAMETIQRRYAFMLKMTQ